MRPISFLLFTMVLAVNLLQNATAEDNTNLTDDIPLEDVEYLSDLWPSFVSLKQSFQVAGSDNIIDTDYRGTLMRVEGDHVVLDFGRQGTHRIHIKETDITTSIQERLNTDKLKKGSLFRERMFNKFFKLKDDEFVQSIKKDTYAFNYFLLFYADMKTEESDLVISWSLESKEMLDELTCSPLLMPMDSTEKELLDDMRELNWIYPSVYHWTYKGHKKSLSFDPTPNPSIILIHRSGRMISRGSNVDFLASVADLIDKDKKKMNKIRRKYNLEKE